MNLYKFQILFHLYSKHRDLIFTIQRDWLNVFFVTALFFFSVFFYFAGKELKKRAQNDKDDI